MMNCGTLSDNQKFQILEHLSTHANKDGVIRVVSQRHRTQKANRETAADRLIELLKGALENKTARKKTNVPYQSKLRRLEEKKKRSILKQQRKKI